MEINNMADWKDTSDFNTWNYKELGVGAKVTGIYFAKKENVGVNNSTLYTIKQANGEKIDVWGSTLLDKKMNGSIELGEEVSIEYLGQKESEKRKGAKYYDFKVIHRKAEMQEDDINIDEIDFNSLGK